jgi:hypothetical protein
MARLNEANKLAQARADEIASLQLQLNGSQAAANALKGTMDEVHGSLESERSKRQRAEDENEVRVPMFVAWVTL